VKPMSIKSFQIIERRAFVICLSSLLLAACVSIGFARQGGPTADWRSIVEAERAFSRASVEKGTRAAFIENLADDSILFRPQPVNGKRWMEEHPAPAGLLTWQPIFADVSSAGDMGYTTGPWEFRKERLDDKPVAHGQYVTVWKKQANGVWKVAIDLGIGNPAPAAAPPAETQSPASNQPVKTRKLLTDLEAERSALTRLETDFAKRVAEKKTLDAFISYLADDVRLFRMNAFPAVGREATRSLLAVNPGLLGWKPLRADVARSNDLGYTYGTYEFKAADEKASEKGNYLRIWKRQRQGEWKVVLDILSPIPPEA
jgi:ketosteroid isomerase-like protein